MPEKKEFIILILLCIIAFDLGYRVGQPKEATDNAIIPKPEEQVVGTPEWKDGDDTYRGVLLDAGVYEWYKNGKKVGELHFKTEDGEVVKHQQPETQPTSTEIDKSKYKLIAENIELKEQIEEIRRNYKALDQRTKDRMQVVEREHKKMTEHSAAQSQDYKNARKQLAKREEEAKMMEKMSLARFASMVNVMKENNELREWKKVAIAAGLKLPKGPVTKPDYVLPPKINPSTNIPTPTGKLPVRSGKFLIAPNGLPISKEKMEEFQQRHYRAAQQRRQQAGERDKK